MSAAQTIRATNGQYLRATMREATDDTLDAVLDAAAAYLGEEAETERLDDGSVTRGALVAVRESICRVHDADDVMPERICGRPLPCRDHAGVA